MPVPGSFLTGSAGLWYFNRNIEKYSIQNKRAEDLWNIRMGK